MLDSIISKSFTIRTLFVVVFLIVIAIVLFIYSLRILRPNLLVSGLYSTGLALIFLAPSIKPYPASIGLLLSSLIAKLSTSQEVQGTESFLDEFLKNLSQWTVSQSGKTQADVICVGTGLTLVLIGVYLYIKLQNENVVVKDEIESGKVRVRTVTFPSSTPVEVVEILLKVPESDESD